LFLRRSTSIDGTVRLWDTRTSSCQKVAYGHTKGILDFAMSPDYARVITASDDCTARIFNFA
jgi:angio-associated migratory cell protein